MPLKKRSDGANFVMSVKGFFTKIKRIVNRTIERRGFYSLYYPFSRDVFEDLYVDMPKGKKIFLLMQPEYGNVGDQAIAYATEEYFKDYFPEYSLVRVTENNTFRHMKTLQRICAPEDLVVLQGGGNMGSLYPQIEHLRRFCIKCFPNNLIISMPTTATYRANRRGRRELSKSKKTFNTHKNLMLLAREQFTFEFMKKYFNAKCMVVPDIVFYLANKINPISAERICNMLCIRKEMESVLSIYERNMLIRNILERFPDTLIYDTEIKRTVDPDIRDLEVVSMLNQFNRSKIVVTDRMHGMIFASITGTPCVVLTSLDKKIEGTYQWIKNLEHIKLVTTVSINDVNSSISQMESMKSCKPVEFEENYWEMIKKFIVGNTRDSNQ